MHTHIIDTLSGTGRVKMQEQQALALMTKMQLSSKLCQTKKTSLSEHQNDQQPKINIF